MTGRRILVTGGSRGIGKAVCEAFAAQGDRVAVASTGPAGERLAAALPGGPHVAVTGDVADPAAVERLVAEAVEALGGLDVVVNNAGVFDELDPLTATYEQWQVHWRRTVGDRPARAGLGGLLRAAPPACVVRRPGGQRRLAGGVAR